MFGEGEIALSDFVIQNFKVVLQCVEDVYNPHFLRNLNYAKDDKIVAHRISAATYSVALIFANASFASSPSPTLNSASDFAMASYKACFAINLS